jgi:conjugal transfer pilus assembly protein TraE
VRLETYAREVALRTGFGRALQGLLVLFIGLTVLLAIALAVRSDNVRTVVVPPVVSKSFWVEEGSVSPEYLEQMALFLAQLVYNVTPTNAEYNTRLLLNHAAPGLYGALRQQGEATARRLRADNATTLFGVRAVTHDPKGLRVALHGLLSTYINEKRVAEAPKVFLFTFSLSGGRLYVTSIVETSDADPLGARRTGEPRA